MAANWLIRAAGFEDLGGWVLDTSAFDALGDAYLLAHGLGRPVADAVTHIALPPGEYRVFAMTRDWVAPYGAGCFHIAVDGVAGKPLGADGISKWHWQAAGVFTLGGKHAEIRLHDMTGFEGRVCSLRFEPVEDAGKAIEPQIAKSEQDCELAVIGGGYAGMCAAVAAARRGVKTALVNDRPVWGGNASNEVRVGPIGGLGLKPFPRNSDHAYELLELTHSKTLDPSGGLRQPIDDVAVEAWLAAEKNLQLYPSARCVACEKDCDGIRSVEIFDLRKGVRVVLRAKHFVDATGDATLARLAGENVRTKPECGETLTGGYGTTNFWTTRWTAEPVAFPPCPWALDVTEENWQVSTPKYPVRGDYPYAAGWNWETGIGREGEMDAEAVRDYNFRAAYGMWDYLKNKSPEREKYVCAEMDWMAYVPGKRAAGRIEGDYTLCERDLVEHILQPDGVVTTTWFLDLHQPHPMNEKHFPDGAFRSIAYDDPSLGRDIRIKPYPIPFRCFYAKKTPNLWMAGKDISVTHVALASVRVENTTAQMGTMVGRAVALALELGVMPRELGRTHFAALAKLLTNPGKPSHLANAGRRRYQRRLTVLGEIKHWLRPVKRLLFG
ncbi:MAG: FAD-dependent oxidoreductase [Kiritimatiellae bacterium]|nr:FAD-dependent oxidoreductase [Kiritimatiellia bacterium]